MTTSHSSRPLLGSEGQHQAATLGVSRNSHSDVQGCPGVAGRGEVARLKSALAAGSSDLPLTPQHIFRLEQAAYREEELPWETIAFTNNQPILVSGPSWAGHREAPEAAEGGLLPQLCAECCPGGRLSVHAGAGMGAGGRVC